MVTDGLDLTVGIAGKTLPNPVGAASGVFGFGGEYDGLTQLDLLGAVYTKAVTPEPRSGNLPPRLAETPSGMINAIGLANPGLKVFLNEKIKILNQLPCPAVVNVAGAVMSDYTEVCAALNDAEPVWGIELNVSCPNVDHGGMAFGTDPAVLSRLVSAVRAVCRKPLIVKLSPNVTDISETARAAAGSGADALSCINTLTGMVVDIHKRCPVIPRGTGGLSGPAIRPVGVAAVWKVSKAVDLPVIGIGGIACAEDAIEYLLAGASAVQAGSALFGNPDLPEQILRGIEDYMLKEQFSRIDDFHGFF